MMQLFKQLHFQPAPLILGNVWDAASARAAQLAGYQAVGTSSAAIAQMLGYEDGEKIPFHELKFIVERIVAVCALPLSVDIEAGFSRVPESIADHIQQLVSLGVVGINIEDSLCDDFRTLVDSEIFANQLSEVRRILRQKQVDVFINVRCDAFLLETNDARQEAIRRARQYEQAGADGFFVPCVTRPNDIQAIAAAINLPLNVMAMPELPDFDVLSDLGVQRVSTGNFAFDAMQGYLSQQFNAMNRAGSCAPLFSEG